MQTERCYVANLTYNWYRTPIGFLTIVADEIGITQLSYGCIEIAGARKCATTLTTLCADQILEYLSGKRQSFNVKLHVQGTEFQQHIWTALKDIPYGQALTASALAEQLGMPNSQRAVGAAVHANPVAIIIPHHRIIAATGKAYGVGKDAQRRASLLQFEQTHLQAEGEGEN